MLNQTESSAEKNQIALQCFLFQTFWRDLQSLRHVGRVSELPSTRNHVNGFGQLDVPANMIADQQTRAPCQLSDCVEHCLID